MYCAQKHRNANSARIIRKKKKRGLQKVQIMQNLLKPLCELDRIGIKHQVNHVENYLELFCSSTRYVWT